MRIEREVVGGGFKVPKDAPELDFDSVTAMAQAYEPFGRVKGWGGWTHIYRVEGETGAVSFYLVAEPTVLALWDQRREARQKVEQVLDRISAFDAKCFANQYTDPGQAWEVLHGARSTLQGVRTLLSGERGRDEK